MLAYILATGLMFSLLDCTVLAAELASSREEWRASFDKNLLDPKFVTKIPETQRVKVLVLFSSSMCQMREHLAALTLEGGDTELAKEYYTSAHNCRDEAIAALKKQLPKARQELAKNPRAVEKLNSYAAVFLSTMSAIPRFPSSARVLALMQQQDKRKLQEKESELDVELI